MASSPSGEQRCAVALFSSPAAEGEMDAPEPEMFPESSRLLESAPGSSRGQVSSRSSMGVDNEREAVMEGRRGK